MKVERLERIDGHALDALAPVLEPDTAQLVAEVAEGVSDAFVIDGDSYVVTRAEGTELVVCALAGRDLEKIAERIYSTAKQQGFKTVRFHTQRKGLARMLERYGPVHTEMVYRVTL